MTDAQFSVRPANLTQDGEALFAVRHAVFVEEQRVPVELERDELDADSDHVIALDPEGNAIGTGRLTPGHSIGRLAVLKPWRGRGVGDALLSALLQQARARGWASVSLHAQVDAEEFYVRHGFVPRGDRFMEAGIEHQDMWRGLREPTSVRDVAAALATIRALVLRTRRQLVICSRALDPGLFDQPTVLEAFRRLSTRRQPVQVQVLLHDALAPQRELAPLLPLAQRLPSVWQFREVQDPADLPYPSAYMANDRGDWYFRPLAQRHDGESCVDDPGRARQLREAFAEVWSRAVPCTGFRALNL